MGLLEISAAGLYCPAGDFYIDPWQPVNRAVITHGHADHARRGSAHYLAAPGNNAILRRRLGSDIHLDIVTYGQIATHNGVRVSLHPAGHILGSAQVRVEHAGEVWVVTGDYKLAADATCVPFEPVRCHTLITESTFGLPIYRWAESRAIFAEIGKWWSENQAEGKASIIYAYALGKAQRLLAGLDPRQGPIVCHGAVAAVNNDYLAEGVALPTTFEADETSDFSRSLVLAPPSAQRSPWLRRFGDHAGAFASGWMAVRGARRRGGLDRGFVLSDHADWPGLLKAIELSQAQTVYVTHGQVAPMVRWLREHGKEAFGLQTRFEGEIDDGA